ncbi:MAG: cell division protein FtsX [Hyphomicrobiales bacterium]
MPAPAHSAPGPVATPASHEEPAARVALPGPSTATAGPRIRHDIAPKPSPVIPADGIAGRPLFLVVTVMSYLASVTLGASLLVAGLISNWTADIAQEITVQIRPVDGVSIDTQVTTAVQLLTATPGVNSADPISLEEAAALLEPWLGSGNVLEDLPIPRLIAVKIDTENPPDLDALAGRLDSEVEGATLNDHRRWQTGLRRMAASLQTIAWAVIVLVSGTTLSIIIFATRAAMAGNREIIEVLHLVGATENFIAFQIQKRFFVLGLVSGLIGVGFTILTFLALNSLTGAVAAGSFTGAATSLMFGPLSLGLSSYLYFLFIPITAAIIGVITSRIIVIGVVRSMH